MNCEFCSSPVHVWFQCPKKPDGWKPARLANKMVTPEVTPDQISLVDRGRGPRKSAGSERSGAQAVHGPSGGDAVRLGIPAVSDNLPVDTNPCVSSASADWTTSLAGVDADKDRPKFNKNEYQKAYMREVYRPRLKAKKEAVK